MINRARHDYIEVSFVYIFAIITILLLSYVASPIGEIPPFGIIDKKQKEAVPQLYDVQVFANLNIKARSYVLYDVVHKKVIAGKKETEVLPLASITKVMTAVTALTHNDKKTRITILPETIEDGYDLGLKKGQAWTLGELLKYTLVFSSNDGALTIAETLGGKAKFVEQMNNDAVLLGLQLHFNDPAGIDYGGILGGQGSAVEVAKLFAVARKQFPEILDATTKERTTVSTITEKLSGVPNTNQTISHLIGVEASKTGFTDSAGGNLGVIVDIAIGHPVVIVVLGSTREERFSDVEVLYAALQKSIVK
jgi:D-alanyl-D-alanine carboxypeptidase